MDETNQDEKKYPKAPTEKPVALTTTVGILFGILGCLLYASQASSWWEFGSVVGVSFMIAGSSALAGGLLGFLFGIPRTLQQEGASEANATQQQLGAPEDQSRRVSYLQNTNLEQISDWLTKILVGVGLTQLSLFPERLKAYAEYAANGLGNFPSSQVFACALLGFFLISGFLVGYLWTRLVLAGKFRKADLKALGEKVSKVEGKLTELEKQVEIDAKALGVAQRQINPSPDAKTISDEEITSAIKNASPNVKAQIFYLAQKVRNENWEQLPNKPRMEKTIPIFRALIASDTENVFHANHGQLGYALKDQRQHDWQEALSELNKAIELRGPWRENGWLFYEFNRAICRIKLDGAFAQGQTSDDGAAREILADIKAVYSARGMSKMVLSDATISAWMRVNNIATTAINSDE